jgi:hypothetical protein
MASLQNRSGSSASRHLNPSEEVQKIDGGQTISRFTAKSRGISSETRNGALREVLKNSCAFYAV